MIFYQGKKKIKLRSNFMKMLLPYAQEDRGRRESSLPPSTSRAVKTEFSDIFFPEFNKRRFTLLQKHSFCPWWIQHYSS
ncbi:mCG140854, isoform CRA_c [Mus musculus]|nr:mCG140854, isoform CRA_c [Mus musculus]